MFARFVALLTLDEHRVEAGRNGCCPCLHHTREEAGLGAGQPRSPALTSRLFNWLGEALVKLPVKARIIIRTYSRSTLVCCCCLDS